MKLKIFTDGAARGNPGPAGAGFLIIDLGNDTVLHEGYKYLGEATNNQAEYSALKIALEKATELGGTELELRLDSELVVKQIRGEYKVKNEGLRPFFVEIKRLLGGFVSFGIEHVRREDNSQADRLANRAIDEAI